MIEVGVDIDNQATELMDLEFFESFKISDYSLCGCARSGSSYTTGSSSRTLGFENPIRAKRDKEKKIEIFRRVRDAIEHLVQ